MRPFVYPCPTGIVEVPLHPSKVSYGENDYKETSDINLITEKRFLYSNILICSNEKCKKTYLHTYSEIDGQKLNDEDVIPKSQKWHIHPIENPAYPNGSIAIPEKTYKIYTYAIQNFNQSMTLSCGFLVGEIIESICIEEGIKSGLFEVAKTSKIEKGKYDSSKKIIIKLEDMVKRLVEVKNLSSNFDILIDELRKFRNDTVHEVYFPTMVELDLCIEAIHDIFEELYLEKYKKELRRIRAGENSEKIKNRQADANS